MSQLEILLQKRLVAHGLGETFVERDIERHTEEVLAKARKLDASIKR
jgi:hypothetical protein